VSIRKIAGLAAGFALAVGLIGNGVSAQWSNQVTAQENIHVGSFGCAIVNWTGGSDPTGLQSVTFNAPAVDSSAAGTAPFSFTVKNTGTVAQVLTVSSLMTGLPTPFSDSLGAASPVFLAGNATQVYYGGLSWSDLTDFPGGYTGNIKYTVKCNETNQTAIFDNHPFTLPGNLASVAFQATSTSEWGTEVTFAGSARKLTTATVTMSSQACQTGSGATCVTTPGATFNVPITFNVYNVGSGSAVGSQIATRTQTFAIPYRPSSGSCSSDNTAWSAECNHGLAANITFDFSSLSPTLPNTVIFGIAYNTYTHGYSPVGSGGPVDSLNVACFPGVGNQSGTTGVQPVVGTFPDPLGTYLNSSYAPFYLNNSAPGTFRLDTGPAWNANQTIGPWGGYEPAVQITATN